MLTIDKFLPDTFYQHIVLPDSLPVPKEEVMIFDIETTGLSRDRSYIYLLGCLTIENNQFRLRQWFAEKKEEEQTILSHFLYVVKSYFFFIHFNGKRFDLPFVEHRLQKYDLPSPFAGKESLDLYLEMDLCRNFLKLSHIRQTDLEEFLFSGGCTRAYCDGGECISLYRSYGKRRNPEISDILLGHNEEDLLNLASLLRLLAYPGILVGNFEIKETYLEEDCLYCFCELAFPVPKSISFSFSDGYLTASKNQLKFQIFLQNGKLRQRYLDFKNYYYLPGEDTVVPRTLGKCMDASLRTPATKENCYTWFPCAEQFLSQPSQIKKYLVHNLSIWVK